MLVYIPTFEPKNGEKEVIQIHDYDTWSMDHTLSRIIYPMLVKFKADAMSFPTTLDQNDVPYFLQLKEGLSEEAEFDIYEKQWEWVLNEMIYAFDLVSNCEDSYPPLEENERMQNGLELFGKYFRHLWR
tara:strand:- start:99 stop:485 length:387 start_codon:yes stop_codon:yes gene_type:complete